MPERTVRYLKPSITNLPYELGVAIFKEIRETPRPDRKALNVEVRKLMKEMVELREREMNAAAAKKTEKIIMTNHVSSCPPKKQERLPLRQQADTSPKS